LWHFILPEVKIANPGWCINPHLHLLKNNVIFELKVNEIMFELIYDVFLPLLLTNLWRHYGWL